MRVSLKGQERFSYNAGFLPCFSGSTCSLFGTVPRHTLVPAGLPPCQDGGLKPCAAPAGLLREVPAGALVMTFDAEEWWVLGWGSTTVSLGNETTESHREAWGLRGGGRSQEEEGEGRERE